MSEFDLQGQALEMLKEFSKTKCDGREWTEVFDCFVALASRLSLEAAALVEKGDPNEKCPLCRVNDYINEATHRMARIMTGVEKPDEEPKGKLH